MNNAEIIKLIESSNSRLFKENIILEQMKLQNNILAMQKDLSVFKDSAKSHKKVEEALEDKMMQLPRPVFYRTMKYVKFNMIDKPMLHNEEIKSATTKENDDEYIPLEIVGN